MKENIASLFDLTGKTALVTGASAGLGKRFSQILADAGAFVFITRRVSERHKQ